jgi:hypothetical protein
MAALIWANIDFAYSTAARLSLDGMRYQRARSAVPSATVTS